MISLMSVWTNGRLEASDEVVYSDRELEWSVK